MNMKWQMSVFNEWSDILLQPKTDIDLRVIFLFSSEISLFDMHLEYQKWLTSI